MPIFSNYLNKTNQSGATLRDFQHAARFYIDDTYAKSPKLGFLYYVEFEINRYAVLNGQWGPVGNQLVGLLVKRIDLPKFKISTETLNQYNRKTVVQTKLNYVDIGIDFHDDNSDITNYLWINYYQHYYADSRTPSKFTDTKFGIKDNVYGRYGRNGPGTPDPNAPDETAANRLQEPFINKIHVYVLHQQKFTQFTLINPKITDWQHDSVEQNNNSKILQNRMTVAYENVEYNTGLIKSQTDPNAPRIKSIGYDMVSSPYNYNAPPQGQIAGIANILLQNYVNKKGLGKARPINYNIAGSLLNLVSQPGSGNFSSPQPSQNQPGIFTSPGGVGINIFKAFNTTVDGKIRANPAAIIFPKI